MTNAEAIRLLTTMQNTCEHNLHLEALIMAITALREKADKERRYQVERTGVTWAVYGSDLPIERVCYARHIPTREAAQRIADIYEEVKP